MMPLAVRDDEVAILMVRAFSASAERNNPIAIAFALGELLDTLPTDRADQWPAARQR